MKTFDWKIAETKNSPQKVLWLKANHQKKITEDEFVTAMKQLKQYSTQPIRKKRNHTYTPHNLRYNYRSLVKNFGFFV